MKDAYSNGFVTLEILMALAIMVMVISVMMPMVSGGQSFSVSSQVNQEALYKAAALLEDARARAHSDFNLVNPIASVQDGIYQKSLDVTVNPLDFFQKTVTSTVAWPGEHGQNLTTSLSTLLTDPKGIFNGAACNSVPANPNGWKNIQHYD